MLVAKCDTCICTYTDKISISIAQNALSKGHDMPCPNMTCTGHLKLEEQDTV